ncbi:MAG: CBS domain-containing protein [Myxococcales bacterium]|nr:CBS domain-containing protein [Myxococcales bacterium]
MIDANAVLERPVRTFMINAVTALTPETSLDAAAKLFHEQRITGAPVVDAECRCVGVLSQTDLLVRKDRRSPRAGTAKYLLVLHGEPTLEDHVLDTDAGATGVVADVMTHAPIGIPSDTTLRLAIERMVHHGVHRLMVIDDGKLHGVITSMDVLRVLAPPHPPRDVDGF